MKTLVREGFFRLIYSRSMVGLKCLSKRRKVVCIRKRKEGIKTITYSSQNVQKYICYLWILETFSKMLQTDENPNVSISILHTIWIDFLKVSKDSKRTTLTRREVRKCICLNEKALILAFDGLYSSWNACQGFICHWMAKSWKPVQVQVI